MDINNFCKLYNLNKPNIEFYNKIINTKITFTDFYEEKSPNYEFSNYYTSKKMSLIIEGKSYPSTEHYFQSMKFTDPVYSEEIRKAKTPNIARILARQEKGGGYKWRTDLNPIIQNSLDRNVKIISNWEEIKLEVMSKALMSKFTQNDYLKKLLLSTGDSIIREVSPRDDFWGTGKNGNGFNMLGILLMRLRNVLNTPVEHRLLLHMFSLIKNFDK